ncbi:MAG: Mrp/NBP35 family ATP-binding protein, partial [Anaerolineae bacterium]|nr:Mrp/NBP35 family ATP-binding protein [Anaerolineae bacterium]
MTQNPTNAPTLTQLVLSRLHTVEDPLFKTDIVSLEMVRNLDVDDGGCVRFTIVLATPAHPFRTKIQQDCEEALYQLPAVTDIDLTFGAEVSDDRRTGGILAKTVRNTIVIASGKGGVGKSTVAVNLALALSQQGARVGMLDLDVYGPSIPMMLGTQQIPRASQGKIMPVRQHGLKVMSMGFLVEEEAPVVWRGPMMHQAIQQLLSDVVWGELDYLVIDLPPGTGDAQITLCQSTPISGSIMVTTPQDVALADVVKGIAMFQDLNVPVLGVVENMSYYECPHCGQVAHLFGQGGGQRVSDRMKVDYLA